MSGEYQQIEDVPGVGRMWHPRTSFRYQHARCVELDYRGDRAGFIPWAERQLANPGLHELFRRDLQATLENCKRTWLE